ncbi:hypothetical protein D6783_02880, partial [Candidatus Woesearchaeota archaeon]
MKGRVFYGCDPEVFLQDAQGNIVPSCGLIGGHKDRPLKIGNVFLLEDNIMAEFGIEPTASKEEFYKRTVQALDAIREVTGLEPYVKPALKFERQWLKAAGSGAFVFGCSPDYDAYSLQRNPTPNPLSRIRTCGGHIHIGLPDAESLTFEHKA